MDKRIRAPFLFIAVILIIACVLLELGGTAALNATPIGGWLHSLQGQTANVDDLLSETGLFDDIDIEEATDSVNSSVKAPKGFGVPYLAIIDGIYAFTLLSTASGLVIPQGIQAQGQGIVTCFYAFSTCIAGIAAIYVAIAAVFLMIALLLAIPFGTIVYFIKFADFNRSTPMAILSLTMLLKIIAVIMLPLAHQGFVFRPGLIVLVLASFICNIIVVFLLSLPPGFLVSITDAIAGIIVAIIGVICSIPLLIGAILSIISVLSFLRKAVRV